MRMLSAFCMSLLVSLLSHEVCSHIILTPISIGAKVMNGRFHVVEKLASSKVRSISQRHTRQLIQKEPDDVTLRSIQTFRQIQLLAAGGFGEVWKAFDTEKKKYVVIKTILYTKNETTQDIFNLKKERLQEIALTRKAQECPNVARMALEEQDDYKYYDEHGGNLLIMDYYAGSHLKQYSKGKTQHGVTGPWNRRLNMVTNLIPQIGVAVSCLHKIGIIHRDNIVLSADQTKAYLIDFGLSQLTREWDKKDNSGTYLLMPPEIFSKKEASIPEGWDWWSLGCILLKGTGFFDSTQSKYYKKLPKIYGSKAKALPRFPRDAYQTWVKEQRSEMETASRKFQQIPKFLDNIETPEFIAVLDQLLNLDNTKRSAKPLFKWAIETTPGRAKWETKKLFFVGYHNLKQTNKKIRIIKESEEALHTTDRTMIFPGVCTTCEEVAFDCQGLVNGNICFPNLQVQLEMIDGMGYSDVELLQVVQSGCKGQAVGEVCVFTVKSR